MEWAFCILLVSGSFFILMASVGIARMPDFLTRMQTTTKASSFGVILVLFAIACYFGSRDAFIHAVAITVFIFITAPVGAHLLGRIAYLMGIPLWSGTVVDDLAEYQKKAGSSSQPKKQKKKKAGGAKISDIFRNLKNKKID